MSEIANWCIYHSRHRRWVFKTYDRLGPFEWTQHANLAKRFTLGQAKEIQEKLGEGAIVSAAAKTTHEMQSEANGAWIEYRTCPSWRWLRRRNLYRRATELELFALRSALNGLIAVSGMGVPFDPRNQG